MHMGLILRFSGSTVGEIRECLKLKYIFTRASFLLFQWVPLRIAFFRNHRSNTASSGGGIPIQAGYTEPSITRFRMLYGNSFASHPKKLVKPFSISIIELPVILTTKECLPIPEHRALSPSGACIHFHPPGDNRKPQNHLLDDTERS